MTLTPLRIPTAVSTNRTSESRPTTPGMAPVSRRKTMLASFLLLSMLLPFTTLHSAVAGGNVGTARDFDTTLFDATIQFVPAHCEFVHRTEVQGGLQDKMHCRLGTGAVLPDRPLTLTDVPHLHYFSDYASLTTGAHQLATTWTTRLTPGGEFDLTAFYQNPS